MSAIPIMIAGLGVLQSANTPMMIKDTPERISPIIPIVFIPIF